MSSNIDSSGYERIEFNATNRILIEPKRDVVREIRTNSIDSDLVVVGGGIAGVCAAIAAARSGSSVVLVQDRPVLGGNASSEVRLWALGATSHMGNNNRWSRESGIIGEILEENLFRNNDGNPLIFDTILLEKVRQEPNIRLLLNTVVHQIEKEGTRRIKSCSAFCSINGTAYVLRGSVFMDCSGDGILAFLAGAAFRMGAESREEFGERLAPGENYGYLLGHSLYFYSKDIGKEVDYIPPAFALKELSCIPRYKSIQLKDFGCRLWWIEYGGRLDTIHAAEDIKWELWKIIYGVWDYIKNSGKFPESKTHTLEWVGTIPGKRESRRFEGMYMLRQQDLVEQRLFEDAVAYGGWALDLHPADGVYSELPGCSQWHTKGVYQIPLRTTISRDIDNLMFGGRIVSASHVAFGSTRVMVTCGYLAQATGIAVSHARQNGLKPADLVEGDNLKSYLDSLRRAGQHIPGNPLHDPADLACDARVTVSSELKLQGLPFDGPWVSLNEATALLMPVASGVAPVMRFRLRSKGQQKLTVQLRLSEKPENFTPEQIVESCEFDLHDGEQEIATAFKNELHREGYVFVTFIASESVELRSSNRLLTGAMTVFNGQNKAVSNNGRQQGSEELGVHGFEFWTPRRRPNGGLIGFSAELPLYTFGKEELKSGYDRPYILPNAWIADPEDKQPTLSIKWQKPQSVRTIVISLDGDFDHAMESVLMGHPEKVVPFCVQQLRIFDDRGRLLAEVQGNHHAYLPIQLKESVETSELRIEFEHPSENVPAAVFSVRCYDEFTPIPVAST